MRLSSTISGTKLSKWLAANPGLKIDRHFFQTFPSKVNKLYLPATGYMARLYIGCFGRDGISVAWFARAGWLIKSVGGVIGHVSRYIAGPKLGYSSYRNFGYHCGLIYGGSLAANLARMIRWPNRGWPGSPGYGGKLLDFTSFNDHVSFISLSFILSFDFLSLFPGRKRMGRNRTYKSSHLPPMTIKQKKELNHRPNDDNRHSRRNGIQFNNLPYFRSHTSHNRNCLQLIAHHQNHKIPTR